MTLQLSFTSAIKGMDGWMDGCYHTGFSGILSCLGFLSARSRQPLLQGGVALETGVEHSGKGDRETYTSYLLFSDTDFHIKHVVHLIGEVTEGHMAI